MHETQRPLPDAPDGTSPAAPSPHPTPTPSPAPSPEPPVSVTVTRSGGFAGLSRRWRAEAEGSDAERWRALIEDCPWEAVAIVRDDTGADRFVWRLDARCGERAREAELADAEITGPWRELIDAVKAAAVPSPPQR